MIETTELAPGLVVPRIVTGLWQVADMERGGRTLDRDQAAGAMAAYAAAGFTAFDMADHYGSAELITGHARSQGVALQAVRQVRLKIIPRNLVPVPAGQPDVGPAVVFSHVGIVDHQTHFGTEAELQQTILAVAGTQQVEADP